MIGTPAPRRPSARRLSVLLTFILVGACGTAGAQFGETRFLKPYSPEMVRAAARNGALVTEVVGSPTEFTGARSVADAMAMPPHFKGILLAGEPPTGPGTTGTRLVLGFNLFRRTTVEDLCADAASIRPGRGKDLDVTAVLCAGPDPVSFARVTGPSYGSLELKEFRAMMAAFLGEVMPATAK